jgi:hypothetical protein
MRLSLGGRSRGGGGRDRETGREGGKVKVADDEKLCNNRLNRNNDSKRPAASSQQQAKKKKQKIKCVRRRTYVSAMQR